MSINNVIRDNLPEHSLIFNNHAYDNSIIGVTINGNIIYDYDKMIRELMEDQNCSFDSAKEWIDRNTVLSLPYFPDPRPIIMYSLSKEIIND